MELRHQSNPSGSASQAPSGCVAAAAAPAAAAAASAPGGAGGDAGAGAGGGRGRAGQGHAVDDPGGTSLVELQIPGFCFFIGAKPVQTRAITFPLAVGALPRIFQPHPSTLSS